MENFQISDIPVGTFTQDWHMIKTLSLVGIGVVRVVPCRLFPCSTRCALALATLARAHDAYKLIYLGLELVDKVAK